MTTTFAEGSERTRALAIWGGIAAGIFRIPTPAAANLVMLLAELGRAPSAARRTSRS